MVRTQVQLTEEQSQGLKEVAAEQGVSVAEVIRQAVDKVLVNRYEPSIEERRERAIAALGRGHSGLGNLAARHDDYLEEAFGD